MIKKFLIIAVIAFLIAGGYFYRTVFFKSSTPTSTTTPEVVVETASETAVPLSGRGTLAEIQSLHTSLECQIWFDQPNGTSSLEGTTFLNSGKIRGDFISQVEGKQVVSSMIMTPEHLYSWSVIDGKSYGVEKTLSGDAASTSLDTREPVPLDATVRYDCKQWGNVDKSIFAPPSDVLFRDVATIEETGMEYGTTFEGGETAGDVCTLCMKVGSKSEQTACLAKFKCSR